MLLAKWIKGAEKNGWRVTGSTGSALHLCCTKQGCTNSIQVAAQNLGPVPDPCTAPHVDQYSRATFQQYENLVGELQRRRRSLGMSQDDVCAASGLADGHINKLEAFARVAQFPTLQLWAQTLGLSISLTPDALPPASAKLIERRASDPYQENQARFKPNRTKSLL